MFLSLWLQVSLTFLKFYFLLHLIHLDELSNEDGGRYLLSPLTIIILLMIIFCIDIVFLFFQNISCMKVEFEHLQENTTFLVC